MLCGNTPAPLCPSTAGGDGAAHQAHVDAGRLFLSSAPLWTRASSPQAPGRRCAITRQRSHACPPHACAFCTLMSVGVSGLPLSLLRRGQASWCHGHRLLFFHCWASFCICCTGQTNGVCCILEPEHPCAPKSTVPRRVQAALMRFGCSALVQLADIANHSAHTSRTKL